jgi:hypothetical protein
MASVTTGHISAARCASPIRAVRLRHFRARISVLRTSCAKDAASGGDKPAQLLDSDASTAVPSIPTPPSSPSKLQLWMMCVKPPMYSVGVAPVLVASGLAYLATGSFNGKACSDLVIGSILVIAWLNMR